MADAFAPVNWKVSGLTEQDFPGLIPLPALPGSTNFVYGGTPSDPSVVRCIRDLKSRGFKVVFYPFLLGTSAGFPWRGRITSPGDLSQTATNDVATFMGSADGQRFHTGPGQSDSRVLRRSACSIGRFAG